VDGDEKLRYLTVVLDKARGDIVQVDGLKVVLLNKPGDLVFEIADLDAVAFVLSIDGTDKPHDDTVEVASGNVHVTLEDVSDRLGGDQSVCSMKGYVETHLGGNLGGELR